MQTSDYHYACPYIREKTNIPWSDIPSISLVDTVTNESPRLKTTVKACWTDDGIFVRFVCEDDHMIATYTERDDPLYEQDVVEIFIDEGGEGRQYIELELSPRNVLFDAFIENDLAGSIKVNKEWDMTGIQTHASQENANTYIYDFFLANEGFEAPPRKGLVWKINFYRIDEDAQGERTYMAWSPTGKNNFHISQRFGSLEFTD